LLEHLTLLQIKIIKAEGKIVFQVLALFGFAFAFLIMVTKMAASSLVSLMAAAISGEFKVPLSEISSSQYPVSSSY